jgi:hypothetical protein
MEREAPKSRYRANLERDHGRGSGQSEDSGSATTVLRYHVTVGFWHWCWENHITGAELARVTGLSASAVNNARLFPRSTVSEQFVARVTAAFSLPVGAVFFRPAGLRLKRSA